MAALKLSAFPEFKGKEDSIAAALQAGATLTQDQLKLNARAYNLLFQLLKENGCMRNRKLVR